MTLIHEYQTLQFKLLHRLTNVNSYLSKCSIIQDSTCNFCFQTDTIDHAFCSCPFNREFLKKCTEWLDNITNISFPISQKEFLLGILNDNDDEYITLYNRFYIYVKAFIWESRKNKVSPYLHNFLRFLKDKIMLEKVIIDNKFKCSKSTLSSRWLDVLLYLNIDV